MLTKCGESAASGDGGKNGRHQRPSLQIRFVAVGNSQTPGTRNDVSLSGTAKEKNLLAPRIGWTSPLVLPLYEQEHRAHRIAALPLCLPVRGFRDFRGSIHRATTCSSKVEWPSDSSIQSRATNWTYPLLSVANLLSAHTFVYLCLEHAASSARSKPSPRATLGGDSIL